MTDNLYQFRNYILEDLIERGYKYIARDSKGTLYAYSHQPIKQSWEWGFDMASNDDKLEDISIISPVFSNIKWADKEPFEITYTTWDSVPIDTKVLVTGLDGSEWKCHFYKKVSNNSILAFIDGKTSWTANDVADVVEVDINNVRLA